MRFRWLRRAPSYNPGEWPWYVREFARIESEVRHLIWRWKARRG